MSELRMVINEYGKFVGKAVLGDIKDSVMIIELMTQKGPVLQGIKLGDFSVNMVKDFVVMLDKSSPFARVYYQTTSNLEIVSGGVPDAQ